MRKTRIVFLCLLSLAMWSVQVGFSETLQLMSFNVQNLFDGQKNGREYDTYMPPSWTEKSYQKRLIAVGKSLQAKAKNFDILVLQEIENKKVVKDLHTYYLPAFSYFEITQEKKSSVQVAVMSRYPFKSVNSHNIHVGGKKKHSTRPVLDVKIKLPFIKGAILQVLAVHLKSRIQTKGKYTSDDIRSLQYSLISDVIDSTVPTIIAGDFNDFTPAGVINEKIKKEGRFYSVKDFLLIDNLKRDQDASILGTYYYRSRWQVIDHILIDNVLDDMVHSEKITILAEVPFITKDGYPNKFSTRKKNFSAVSDHLPLLFIARLE